MRFILTSTSTIYQIACFYQDKARLSESDDCIGANEIPLKELHFVQTNC